MKPAGRFISFIVPAYNENTELPPTLQSIRHAAERASCPYEIVVVDDASTDGTPQLARRLGARVLSIARRQIAAARNAGAQAARAEILIFIDADTHITPGHVRGVIQALDDGCPGGGARLAIDRPVPIWGGLLFRLFTALYFALNLGAGAFLFTTRANFFAVGGFNESYFAGEEVIFSLALRKIGRFRLLSRPAVTSGRKLRLYSAAKILRQGWALIAAGPGAVLSREKLVLWYGGAREHSTADL